MTTAAGRLDSVQVPWSWLCVSVALTVLSGSYLSVLYNAVDIDGDPGLFFLVVGGAVVGGLLLGRFVGPSIASLCVGMIVAGGIMLYTSTIPEGYSLVVSVDALWTDLVALLTGLSILQIINAGVWATAVAPVPTFLTAYFTARHQYGWAALVGCLALGFLILTGDVDTTIGLIGVLGATAVAGFGDFTRHGRDLSEADTLAIVLAVVVVLTTSVSVVPNGGSSPVLGGVGGDGSQTIEGSLTRADSQLPIRGSTSLSPTVRFTIESDREAYWRVGAYDRYTGSGWVRTADNRPYDDPLSEPEGETGAVSQQVRARAPVSVMPAAWKPISVQNRSPLVTEFDGLQPTEQLNEGDSYTVTSAVPTSDPAALRNASTEDPDEIRDRYTQLPDSTPDRVQAYTKNVTANADNRYDTASVIEHHLQSNWNYSLQVQQPDNHVADSFLFEMDQGYCTYFATTMVTMLRTQNIPARLVVGYAPGERVGSNQWVVRGLDSHAWVEVYFPEHGWVQFDPTASDPREQAEQSVLDSARSDGVDNVDTNQTEPTPTPSPSDSNNESGSSNEPPTQTPVTQQESEEMNTQNLPEPAYTPDSGDTNSIGSDSSDDDGLVLPSREQIVFGAIVLIGVAATIRRSEAKERAYRAVWLHRQPRTDPKRDVERAFDRLEYLLERRHRPRRSGETRTQYVLDVGDVDDRRVTEIYEQTVYAGDPSRVIADEAIEIVDKRVKENTIVQRFIDYIK